MRFDFLLTGPTSLKNAIVSSWLFSRLKYPDKLINSTITRFIAIKATEQPVPSPTENNSPEPVRVVLPFKDQASADILRTQLKDLSQKINTTIQPVFVSHKIERDLKLREVKPPVVNQQCLVYLFNCDLCDAGYVGFTCRCHSGFGPPRGFGPPGPNPLADMDPLSRIWTPLKTSVLLSKIGKIVFWSC